MLFNGESRTRRIVSGSANKRQCDTKELLENARKLREARALEKLRITSATLIQSVFRSSVERRKHIQYFQDAFDKSILEINKLKALLLRTKIVFSPPVEVLHTLFCQFQMFHHTISKGDSRILELLKIFQSSLLESNPLYNYYKSSVAKLTNKAFVLARFTKMAVLHLSCNTQSSSQFRDLYLTFVETIVACDNSELLKNISRNVAVECAMATRILFREKDHFEFEREIECCVKFINILLSQSNANEGDHFKKMQCYQEILSIPCIFQCESTELAKFAGILDDCRAWKSLIAQQALLPQPQPRQQSHALQLTRKKHAVSTDYKQHQLSSTGRLLNGLIFGNMCAHMQNVLLKGTKPSTQTSGDFISAANEIMKNCPIVYLMHLIEGGGDVQEVEEEGEGQCFTGTGGAFTGGVRALEMEMKRAQSKQRNDDDSANDISGRDLSAVVSCLSGVTTFFRQREIVSILFNCDSIDNQQNMQRNMEVARVYVQLLSCCPTAHGFDGVAENLAVKILSSLAFSHNAAAEPLTARLWRVIRDIGINTVKLALTDVNSASPVLQDRAGHHNVTVDQLQSGTVSLVTLFCAVYTHQLTATNDEEFFGYSGIPNQDLVMIVEILQCALKYYLWTAGGLEIISQSDDTNSKLLNLYAIVSITKLFNSLFARQQRRMFVEDSAWRWTTLTSLDFQVTDTTESQITFRNPKATMLMSCIPQVLPFNERVVLFQSLLEMDVGRATNRFDWHSGMRVQIRRDQFVEDAFSALSAAADLKGRISVEFISEQGMLEPGIDGGGLFKSFMDDLFKLAFAPDHGFFVETSTRLIAPNPLTPRENLKYFNFLGKMLGKAIFEGLLVEPQFSHVFLNTMLGITNEINDFSGHDVEFYNSLMKLKSLALDEDAARAEAAVAELCLNFETDQVGENQQHRVVELMPGGSRVPVTRQNARSYIHHMVHYKLNVETFQQSRAFLAGFRTMISLDWIRMFNARELQYLISGEEQAINITDMRQHVNYAGGYADSQPYIEGFWQIVSEMTIPQQRNLLKFVTSCSRQPLLGFAQLNPKFGIYRVQLQGEEGLASRLPSAATCMNLLKLPQYASIEQLREKLLYAIESNCGFELS